MIGFMVVTLKTIEKYTIFVVVSLKAIDNIGNKLNAKNIADFLLSEKI